MELTGTNRPTQHTHARHTRASERQRTRERASGTRSVPRTTPQRGGWASTIRSTTNPRHTRWSAPHGARAGVGHTRTEHRGTHPRHHHPHTGDGRHRGTRPDQARPGGHSGGATPGPIPNPEAKTPSADGTAPARVRKSRTPPGHHNTTTQEVPRSERVHMTRTCSRQVPHCIVFSLTRGGAVR